MGTNFVCFKDKASTPNGCACCLEGSKYLLWGYLFQSVVASDCTDWCILYCAWICPDSTYEVCLLQNRAKGCIICSSMNDCLMFWPFFCVLNGPFFCVLNVTIQIVRWHQNELELGGKLLIYLAWRKRVIILDRFLVENYFGLTSWTSQDFS